MRRLSLLITSLSVFATSHVMACSDDYCEPEMTLTANQCGLSALPYLSPANDTRVNLALLLAEQGKFPLRAPDADYPSPGRAPFTLASILEQPATDIAAAEPPPPPAPPALARLGIPAERWQREVVERGGYGSGSYCQSNDAVAATAFIREVDAAALPVAEARALVGARLQLTGLCEGETFPPLTGLPKQGIAGDFSRYLAAATAFYAGRLAEADTLFQALTASPQPWIAETARYLLIRAPLNEAQAKALSEWGDFDPARLDAAKLRLAVERTDAYLGRYPQGLYAASANGLYRRLYWLLGDHERLAARYAVDWRNGHALDLLEEVDNKIFVRQPDLYVKSMPELYLVQALRSLREDQPWMSDDRQRPRPTAEALRRQLHADFGDAPPDWSAYLLAAQHYFVTGDAAATLKATGATRPASPLGLTAFSREILHGLALAQLQRWPDAEQHWRTLLAAETDRLRLPLLQLALAMTLERADKLDTVFAADTPITGTVFRRPLLGVAPAPLLRTVIASTHLPPEERQAAAVRLLRKDLTRARYSDFLGDLTLAEALGPNDFSAPSRAVDSVGYDCPTLVESARILEKAPDSARALNCLADYFREYTDHGYEPLRPDLLGGSPDRFGGRDRSSLDLYRRVIDNPKASDDDRAYALHRALRCFATSGGNHCDGQDIAKAQRKRWFTLLKTRYGKTSWGRAQRVYW